VTFTAALNAEPTNPHDAQAIRVDIQNGAQVGYLSREDAEWYQPVFAALAAQHLTGVVRAKLIGGVADKPSIGVMLDLRDQSELLESLEKQPF
jgi:HIRAN domain